MNAKELAEALQGVSYPLRLGVETKKQAKESGLVIVYGASDDLTEFEGSIDDERGAYEGATHWVTGDGLYPENKCYEGDRCPNWQGLAAENAVPLRAIWCSTGSAAWKFDFPVLHEKFIMKEDGEVWCEGIVFSLEAVKTYLMV